MLENSFTTDVQTTLSIKDLAVQDVTVVMPCFENIQHLKHYLDEGLWKGLNLHLVYDRSSAELAASVKMLQENQESVNINSFVQNGKRKYYQTQENVVAPTKYFTFCNDEDFMSDAQAFLNRAAGALNLHDDILFVSAPLVYSFNEKLDHQLQNDRQLLHRKTGAEILTQMVQSGDMGHLAFGSVFRSKDVKELFPHYPFRKGERFTFLARLCAEHPDKMVHVERGGVYMQHVPLPDALDGVQDDEMLAEEAGSFESIVSQYVMMFVGAYYLFKLSRLRTPLFQKMLKSKGEELETKYGMGRDMADLFSKLLVGNSAITSDMQAKTHRYLKKMQYSLPEEFLWLIGWRPGTI